jgi:hypothetical protein
MQTTVRYVEPLSAYLRRKYLELGLSFLPLVATGAVYWAVLRGGDAPLWAILYAGALGIVLPAALLLALRDRWSRRRFRITDGSIDLPSVVAIDGSSIESLPVNSVLAIGTVRGELGILGMQKLTDVEAEIRIRHKEADITLVWPIRAFGRNNFAALARALPARRSFP